MRNPVHTTVILIDRCSGLMLGKKVMIFLLFFQKMYFNDIQL